MTETDRSDIRDAFYRELVGAAATTHSTMDNSGKTVTTTLDASDVLILSPSAFEDTPCVVYDDSHSRIEMNGVGAGPNTKQVDDATGDTLYETWKEPMRSTFRVTVRAQSELAKEPIYEAVRRAFGNYDTGPLSSRAFDAAVFDITVRDSNTADTAGVEDPIRGDEITVEIDWHRDYELDEDTIETVETEADADTDSNTTGDTYTIT